ncbi:MAG: IS1634 family transposase [Anaeroplasma sp.]|uniref:IS1634 family transposase n=1 Tax=Anaeroplasma sp. TaxID=1872523 RepID=UPI002A91295B|nr:IS1634 family transposase [Anaeroplasma sp.]MDY5983353.1 IS1634 family transposase [Anaeroplasma sp.]
MKIWYDRKSKDPSYFVQQGIRNGKKVTTKNIFKIGKHSELLAQGHQDPLAYAKEVVEEYNKKMKSEKVDLEITIDFNKKLIPSDNVSSKSSLLNIGYFFLQDIYSKLNLKDFIKNITKDKKITYNLNDITRFLTFDRILNPRSKLAAVNNLDFFYEKPSFSHQNVLRGMDILADHYDSYLQHLFENSNTIVKRDTSICYYDCTNYYFEVETADEPYYDEVTGEYLYGLRQYGPSKEHRPNPIVEMGLFMDKDGIPLTMGLYPGNMNEQKTVHELESKMIRTLKNKRIIYCGDAGLGSASIRVFNDLGGRAFIVTQSIKKLSDELQNDIFNDTDYKLLSNNSCVTLKHMKSFNKFDENNISLYQDKAYKEIIVDSNVDLGLFEEKTFKNGNTKTVKSKAILKQKIIITYSRKMAEYQKNIRNKQIERAKALLARGVDDIRKGPNDIARFIKCTNRALYTLDQDRIDLEEKYDGFYAIATNLLEDDPKDIIEINSQRYKIEDCFRVLKTNFDARPVHHRLDKRIVAHFMICYTALLIYRLLEKQLKDKKYDFTINEILTTLKNMNVSNRDGLFYEAEFTSSKVCTALNDLFNFGLDKKYYQNSELTKLVKKI